MSAPDIATYEARRNPFPVYQDMFRKGSVQWNDVTQGWYVLRFDDVALGLRDTRFSASRLQPIYNRLPEPLQQKYQLLFRSMGLWTLLLDPPEHTKLRKLISTAFAPRLINQMRPRIQAAVDELLAPLIAQGQFNLIQDFSYPLPAIIIGEMLGVPVEDRDKIKPWSDAIAALFGAVQMSPTVIERTQDAIAEMNVYFSAILAARQANPQDDLLTSLLQAEVDGEKLTDEQVLATCNMLIFGGHETTAYLIANAIVAFTQHPDQKALLLAQPSLIENAIEECLRYDPPVHRTTRATIESVTIGETVIPAGQRIYLMLGAANHDPQQYDDPESFDIQRKDIKHLGLGYGLHFCVGATLGRLESQIAVQTLLERLPNLRIVGEVEYMDSHSFHAPKELTVAFDA